jgi:hypothetical protein
MEDHDGRIGLLTDLAQAAEENGDRAAILIPIMGAAVRIENHRSNGFGEWVRGSCSAALY